MDLHDGRGLAEALERHQGLAMADLACESVRVAGAWLSCSGPGSYLNKACGFPLDRDLDPDALEAVIAWFVARGAEPRIELTSFAPLALARRLLARGFVLGELEHKLVRALPPGEDLRRAVPRWPEGVALRRVDASDAQLAEGFARTVALGFLGAEAGAAVELPDEMLEFPRAALTRPGFDCVAVLEGERLVGGGCADTREGIAALVGGSVLPGWRGRGIQAALITTRLQLARDRGCSLATIGSAPGIPTERNALRLGFRIAYARLCFNLPGPGLGPSR